MHGYYKTKKDVCAGVIIVKEAGGVCENWKQKSFYDVLNRDVICVRSSADGDKRGQVSLIAELRTCLIDIVYERD
jgi:3'-phosphoadenosine 5'-phosphosulfate (PAPS) 3'-phosphatase